MQSSVCVLLGNGHKVRVIIAGVPYIGIILQRVAISGGYPSCILSFTKALSRNNLTKMLSSSYIDEYHVILQVLGSHHFHLLAFHVIQGNQVIVRGEKRKTVESVLNCLKVSYIEMKHFRTHRHSSVSPFVR